MQNLSHPSRASIQGYESRSTTKLIKFSTFWEIKLHYKLPEHHVDQSLQPSSKFPGPSQSAQAERRCAQVPAWTRKINSIKNPKKKRKKRKNTSNRCKNEIQVVTPFCHNSLSMSHNYQGKSPKPFQSW